MSESARAEVVGAQFDVDRAGEYSPAPISALPEATVIIVGRDETMWVAEGRLLKRNGCPPSAVSGRKLDQILPALTIQILRERFRAALSGDAQNFDYRTVDGKSIWWVQLSPMYFGAPEPAAVLAVVQDVTERHQLSCQLRSERERRRMAEEMAHFGHWEIDLATQTVTISDGTQRLLGISGTPKIPMATLLRHVGAADRPLVTDALGKASEAGIAECECDLQTADGSIRRVLMRGRRAKDPEGREVIAGTTIDITELRSAESAQRESEAMFRQGFDGSPIGMALTEPSSGRYLQVNDALCRWLGRSREELLGLSFRDVTCPEDAATDEAGRRSMYEAAASSFQVEKRYLRSDREVIWGSLHVSPVFGPDGRISAFFSQIVDMTVHKERELELLQEAADLERLAIVREALTDQRLVLHAQPIVEIATGEVVQQELLVRLQQRDGTIMPPAEFLPVAERHGCIQEIDRWVTARAIELAAEGSPVEVNLSAASVGDGELLAVVRSSLERTGADPSLIIFEVTETALMADFERAHEFAVAVHELGCRFALDDFGTGYGTFTYLKHIPIDYVKIDIEFVRDLTCSEADSRLVSAIVTMAKGLGKVTVAEGVEDAVTLECLRELGVDHAQGYFLGRPAPIELGS
ncbi:MAG: EAL domain-containing protein [Solirubrobacteraceae bacterium]